MFNLLITADEHAWESDQRLSMQISRFKERSGDEAASLSLDRPEALKKLEASQSLLMYEVVVTNPHADVVRVGQMRDVRLDSGNITFRFTETGRIPREQLLAAAHRLQMDSWESSRTHWAVKDGHIPQDILRMMTVTPKKYDVVLSFAGEDRDYVEQVARFLGEHDVANFYDKDEQVTLWGKDLPEHFDGVYRQHGRFCVMFISKYYAQKIWTRLERRSALARAMAERLEYVLPVRFDDTEIEGLRPTIGYLNLKDISPEQLGQLILQKLGRTG